MAKALNDDGLSLYGSYEYTRIMYGYADGSPEEYGDTLGTFWLGIRYNMGGTTGRKLPNMGQWVAYNANEIE